MILADTSVWISYLRRTDAQLEEIFDLYLKKKHIYLVSAVFGELLQGARNRKEREMLQRLWGNMPKVKEDFLFIDAGMNSNKYKLINQGVGLVDSYIMAACIKNNLPLWTLDKRLQRAFDAINDGYST